jgi:hypothetical protein
MHCAPVAQRLRRGFRFEGVPGIDRTSSGEQVLEFRVGTSPAEEIADVVEIVGQKLARKIEHQRLAQPELAFVRERDVFSSSSMSSGSSSYNSAASGKSV